jgi:hypothetical protein
MDELFKNLTADEKDVLHFAPAWIALLIAGADDHIDGKELKTAIAFINEKKESAEGKIKSFYEMIAGNFRTDLNGFKELLPKDTEKRNELLVKRIEQLNDIFHKTDKTFARQYYRDMKEMALKVAEASGGILGLNPVNKKEKEFLSLDMIRDPG